MMNAVAMNDAFNDNDLSASDAGPDHPHFFTDLFRKLPVALYCCDKDGYISHYNQAAVALWGREPVIGADRWVGALELYRADGSRLQPENSPLALAMRAGEPIIPEEVNIVRPDGSTRVILAEPRLFHDAAGKVMGAVNMLTDITERRYTEVRMAHLAAIVDSSDDAIISKTLDGTITSWNDAAERILGYTAAEAVGRPITMLIPADRLEEEPQIVRRLTRGERVDHFETRRVTKHGAIIDVSLTISPVKSKDGRVIGASKILRDITVQKESERLMRETESRFTIKLEQEVVQRTAELLRINEELERSNHELEQYAYIASHDLQEPLRKIQTFADLLKNNLHDPVSVDLYFNKINLSAQRMSGLIKDVLNYSRLSRAESVWQQVDLNQVLQEVKNDFELLIEQRKATFTVDLLPVIEGDLQQLRQLLGNLVSNAIKFCEQDPHIQIHAATVSVSGDSNEYGVLPGRYAQLEFVDNGIGFEQKYADQVFVVFKRLNNRHHYSGTGIGLALCKKIVERHKGAIRASSQPGKGAAFQMLFPLPATSV